MDLFDHLYTDFRKLVKSKALGKSAFTWICSNYLECNSFLEELTQHWHKQTMNPNYQVFPSEPRLHGNSSITNHRVHLGYMPVQRRLICFIPQRYSSSAASSWSYDGKADQLSRGGTGNQVVIFGKFWLVWNLTMTVECTGDDDWLKTQQCTSKQDQLLKSLSTNETTEWLAIQPFVRHSLIKFCSLKKERVTNTVAASLTSTRRGVFETKRSSSCQGEDQGRQERKRFTERGNVSVIWSVRPDNKGNTKPVTPWKSEIIRNPEPGKENNQRCYNRRIQELALPPRDTKAYYWVNHQIQAHLATPTQTHYLFLWLLMPSQLLRSSRLFPAISSMATGTAHVEGRGTGPRVLTGKLDEY